MVVKKVVSSRFGEIEVDEKDIIYFQDGLPGFPDKHEFVLIGDEEQPIKWLQSLEDGSLALPVTSPFLVFPAYDVEIPDEDVAELGITSPEEAALLVVLVIPPGRPLDMTANLRAPIVVNVNTKKAKQVVVLNEEYPIRYPVFGPEAKALLEQRASEQNSVESKEG